MTIALTPKKSEAWAPKLKKRSKSFEITRPLTATLERPLVLNIALLKKLDMTSFTKKGLIAISKLAGISLLKKVNSKRSLTYINKRFTKKQAFAEPVTKKDKKTVAFDPEYSSWEDESSASEMKLKKRVTRLPNKLKINDEDSWADEESGASDVKNRKRTEKNMASKLGDTRVIAAIKKSRSVPGKKSVDNFFGVPLVSSVPEPCKTCGRTEQSERFHSHPKIKMPENGKPGTNKVAVQKTAIMKPIPAKFKSVEKTKQDEADKVTSEEKHKAEKAFLGMVTAGRPRTVTCYICSREFGTASYPLHEPKCIQKWERENALLQPELRRKLPEKPIGITNLEEWNNFAWKASQATLIPCQKCGRTFNPDRLQVHNRVCKEPSPIRKIEEPRPTTAFKPRTVTCNICGRDFGTQSIEIHKPQCLKKMGSESCHGLATAKTHKPVIEVIEDSIDAIWADHMESLVPCPKCGRRFFSDRVERHISCCNSQPVNIKCKSSRK